MLLVICAHLSKLVLDDCQLLAVSCRQDVVQERSLAAPEKARENRDGHAVVFVGHRCTRRNSFARSEPWGHWLDEIATTDFRKPQQNDTTQAQPRREGTDIDTYETVSIAAKPCVCTLLFVQTNETH